MLKVTEHIDFWLDMCIMYIPFPGKYFLQF